jgi:hypothetical protein
MAMSGQGMLMLSLLLSFAAAVAFLITSAVTSPAQVSSAIEPRATVEPAPADRTTVLVTQFAAGVRGSRAPPAQSA